MKILIPVDESERYKSVLTFISRLQFKQVEVRFFHAVLPISIYDDSITSVAALCEQDLIGNQQIEAKARLEIACTIAKGEGFNSTFTIEVGDPETLIEMAADQFDVDLVALASHHKGPLERLVSGSIALHLVENFKGDLLIVRGDLPLQKDVSLVYATSYEEGSEECLNRMFAWNMKGIGHAEVLNAYKLVKPKSGIAGRNSPSPHAEEIESMMRARIQEKTDLVADRFAKAGVSANGQSLELPVEEAISQVMYSTNSDLLVLAAQRHNTWIKFIGGSTAARETKAESFSLLILRESSPVHRPALKTG